LDYDKVREESMKLWKAVAITGRNAIDSLTAEVHPIIKAVDEVDQVRAKT